MANQNYKQARAAAISSLDNLGQSKTDFETGDMFSAAENDVAAFIERVKENIESADMIVTGKIADLKIETTDSSINILGNPWLIYQDRGVNGSEQKLYNTPHEYTDKMPPKDVFVDYIKTKNLQVRNEENYSGNPHPTKKSGFEEIDGNDKAIDSAAWAMAKQIYKLGFRPRRVFAKEIPQLVTDLSKSIAGFSASMITSSIKDKYGNNVMNKK